MIKLVGIPYEGGENFLKGTTEAPYKMRWALESLEVYSIYQDSFLPDYRDLGDFIPPEVHHEEALKFIEEKVREILPAKIAVIGGDHNITFPVVKALKENIEDFWVVHLDAHLDTRDTYRGNKFTHASVMRRVLEIVGENRVISVGYRSYAQGEEIIPQYSAPFKVFEPLKKFIDELNPEKVYLTLDLDVLDPSVFPAVSNPEPGGISFRELMESILLLKGRLVGFDMVEFNPLAFQGTYPAVTAALILRELLIALK